MSESKVLSPQQLLKRYGSFFEKSPGVKIDSSRVPQDLLPLVAYAMFWGITDDLVRENLVREAPEDIKANLKKVVAQFDDALDAWLAGDEAENPRPSSEYLAYPAMGMASDFV